jgi:hypothetical protein
MPRLKPDDNGKFVAIEIEIGDYEIADEADRFLRGRCELVIPWGRAVSATSPTCQ